jgi:hypothetical protein
MYGNDPTDKSGITAFGAISVVVVLMMLLVAGTALVASSKAISRLDPNPQPASSAESNAP